MCEFAQGRIGIFLRVLIIKKVLMSKSHYKNYINEREFANIAITKGKDNTHICIHMRLNLSRKMIEGIVYNLISPWLKHCTHVLRAVQFFCKRHCNLLLHMHRCNMTKEV